MTTQDPVLTEEIEELLNAIEPLSRRYKVRRAIVKASRESTGDEQRANAFIDASILVPTLRAIRCMPRWIEDARYDLNRRRRIKDILKHVDHNQSWIKTVCECQMAILLVMEASLAYDEPHEHIPDECVTLDEKYSCFSLNSAVQLRAAGRRARNCLAIDRFGHISRLQSGESKFYEIRELERPVAWLEVNCQTQVIEEIKGPRNGPVSLPWEVVWRLCKQLDINVARQRDWVNDDL